MPADKCVACGKTVYPLESLVADSRVFHKLCFKCEAEGCGIKLELKTATIVGGKIYCSKHVPKDKPTGALSFSQQKALEAPKVGVVNDQIREIGTDRKGTGALSFSQQKAVEAPKVGVVNEQIREIGTDRKGTGALSMAQQNAMEAPKVGVINEQVREIGIDDRKGTGALSMAQKNALDAPKVEVQNPHIRVDN
jgi:hypothetical protein